MAFIDGDRQQDLIKANVPQEVIPAPDFYRQYFDGVAMLLKGEVRKGFSQILFYSDKDQPDLIIVRHVAKLLNGNIAFQDENQVADITKLDLDMQDKLAQLNFETNAAGQVVSGPTGEPSPIMRVFAEELNRIRQINGAMIRIDNTMCFKSDGTQWIDTRIRPPAGIGQADQGAPQLNGPVAE